MKRRDFLALVSSVGASATLGGLALGAGAGATLEVEGEPIRVHPRRQGVGYPVEVRVTLPDYLDLDELPELRAVREEVPEWSRTVEVTEAREEVAGKVWTMSWTPPVVRPSTAELQSELIRFRLVALDSSGRVLCPVSGPVEVVCGMRGWGC